MLKTFLWLGRLEGLSLLILLFIAMPMKYGFDNPGPVRVIGAAHGGLFLLYLWAAVQVQERMNWDLKTLVKCLIFSSIPFGTFYFEKKYAVATT